MDIASCHPCRSRLAGDSDFKTAIASKLAPTEDSVSQSSLCSIAYFTSSANEVMLSFCISRAL